MKVLIILLLIVLFPAGLILARKRTPSVPVSQIDVGYAIIQTVVAASKPGGPEHLTPGVLIRIYSNKDDRESFAFSNADGIALAPLRPGSYCLEAFSRRGSRLELTESQKRCFDVRKNEDTEIGVELLDKQAGGIPSIR